MHSSVSLPGVKLIGDSFPVGKIEFLYLYPMNFEEFLTAVDDQMSLEILNSYERVTVFPEVAHNRIWEKLKEYYITGGMPQVVFNYIESRDNRIEAMKTARKLQEDLVRSYSNDFAKHSGKNNSMHIQSVFNNVPMQLSRNIDASVKRYRFKDIIPGKKGFRDLQGPVEWLEKAGLVIKVKVCNRSELPLELYCRDNIFKLFFFDIGLLGSMLGLPFEAVISQDYGMLKGYFAENLVAQEFTAASIDKLYSWQERNSEIEFLRIINGEIVPVEVKSGSRTQAKSLKQYIIKYNPARAIKISGKTYNLTENRTIQNYPLYLAGKI